MLNSSVVVLTPAGETDWKIIAIDVNDPLAEKLNDIDDVEKEMPGYLHETYVWFRDYKGANGNKFAFEGKAKPRVRCPLSLAGHESLVLLACALSKQAGLS
jgi:inorganic pyrophosphatase